MKTKRCTNSSCRREFKLDTPICPHCGKKYPRANTTLDKNRRYAVILSYVGPSKLMTIKVVRKHTGFGLRDSKELIDHTPSLIGKRFRASQAEALNAEIRAAGGDAMIVPASRGTKGVFVLPKKAG
ncbi:MAG: ribosomal protein L7/L12 [Oscillospiraceae bacterium]|nr:ribosomal protein L7/L12 [Oscillospiraceae bacterium]